MDILLTVPGGAQVDDLEPPGLITSLLTPACLRPVHFRTGGQWLAKATRTGRLTDVLTD